MDSKTQKFFILVGPSGSGKGSVMYRLSQRVPDLKFVTTCVTREMRPGEEDGVSYHFLTKEAFHTGIEAGDFLEYDAHYDNFYGTRKRELQAIFDQNCDAVTDLNWAGVVQIIEKMGDYKDGGQVVPILIMPPSFSVLAERLQLRTAQGGRPLSAERLEKVRHDFEHMHDADYVFTNPDMIGSKMSDYGLVVENNVLDEAVAQVLSFVESVRAV